MIATLTLPRALCDQLEQEAKAAFPRECCGLIEGCLTLSLSKGEVTALHPTLNLAHEPDRFEIDAVRHLALLRNLRGTRRTIIGCYHSHPNGRAEPSPRDKAGAAEVDFLWLIAALRNEDVDPETVAFVWTGSCFAPVIVNRV